jgi:hypothetical protein
MTGASVRTRGVSEANREDNIRESATQSAPTLAIGAGTKIPPSRSPTDGHVMS